VDHGIGIVGLGEAAEAHMRAFRAISGAHVVAVCSRRPVDRAGVGGSVAVHRDYEAMLADPGVDVVDICTTHDLHESQAVAAARAGKHLIVEKPIALTFDGLKRVRDAVRATGVGFCAGFECRWGAHFQLTRSLIDQGFLGVLHYAEVDYLHGFGPWYRQFGWNVTRAQGGGSLLTAGCHALDGLLNFVDAPPVEVVSYGAHSRNQDFAPYEYPPTTVTLVRFANGAVGKVASVLDCLQPYHLRVHLFGSEGTLADDRMFRAFFACLDAGRPMPLTGLDEAFATHRVIFAADRSAAEGRPVGVEELSG
jgi:predicted dehydrogenase